MCRLSISSCWMVLLVDKASNSCGILSEGSEVSLRYRLVIEELFMMLHTAVVDVMRLLSLMSNTFNVLLSKQKYSKVTRKISY